MKIYRNLQIEEIAESRLQELERVCGCSLSPPVPIDTLAEQVLGLDFLWDVIEELPGETIFGGLIPKERLIILNEKHRDLFESKPGLERSTKGHEMGHWDLFIDQGTLNQPTLFDLDDAAFARRRSGSGEVEIVKLFMAHPEGLDLLREVKARADDPDEARAVNRYAAAISMPREMIKQEALKIDRTQWRNLYRLAEKFDVTITALKVRLEQLNLLYVDDSGTIHESRSAAAGQRPLEF